MYDEERAGNLNDVQLQHSWQPSTRPTFSCRSSTTVTFPRGTWDIFDMMLESYDIALCFHYAVASHQPPVSHKHFATQPVAQRPFHLHQLLQMNNSNVSDVFLPDRRKVCTLPVERHKMKTGMRCALKPSTVGAKNMLSSSGCAMTSSTRSCEGRNTWSASGFNFW